MPVAREFQWNRDVLQCRQGRNEVGTDRYTTLLGAGAPLPSPSAVISSLIEPYGSRRSGQAPANQAQQAWTFRSPDGPTIATVCFSGIGPAIIFGPTSPAPGLGLTALSLWWVAIMVTLIRCSTHSKTVSYYTVPHDDACSTTFRPHHLKRLMTAGLHRPPQQQTGRPAISRARSPPICDHQILPPSPSGCLPPSPTSAGH